MCSKNWVGMSIFPGENAMTSTGPFAPQLTNKTAVWSWSIDTSECLLTEYIICQIGDDSGSGIYLGPLVFSRL